jgi:hypothetical protein
LTTQLGHSGRASDPGSLLSDCMLSQLGTFLKIHTMKAFLFAIL